MGAFETKTTLYASPSLIPAIADRICGEFAADGYEVNRDNLVSGGVDISLTKGGIFKAVLGMKTALKVTLIPEYESIKFEAGVGIFGQQAIPTLIMLFITWPVLLTQIWGLVQQSKLDDKALAAAQAVIAESANRPVYQTPPPRPSSFSSNTLSTGATPKFCTCCGTSLPAGARFCSNCGSPLN